MVNLPHKNSELLLFKNSSINTSNDNNNNNNNNNNIEKMQRQI